MKKNLPNQITTARLFMAIIIVAILAGAGKTPTSLVLDIAWVVFLLAALTDILDGYLARKYDLVTVFGRIADPFVDKILVCGTFICLLPLTSLIQPWMVVVIVGREFLISGLRGYAESQGFPFPAIVWGKMKTIFQCTAIVATLIYLAHLNSVQWVHWFIVLCIWGTVIITILSGYFYITRFRKIWLAQTM